MMDYLEKRYDKLISKLPQKEQEFFRNVKNWMFQIYNGFAKPILWAIFLFWLFTKIKNAVGLQEAFYIQGVIIILLLRIIASRLI